MQHAETPHVESTGLIPSISIEGLIAARDQTQVLYAQIAELSQELTTSLSRFGVAKLPCICAKFDCGEAVGISDASAIKQEIDRLVWAKLYSLTNIDTIMDHKTRNELYAKLHRTRAPRYRSARGYGHKSDDDLLELTQANIEATFQTVYDDQLEYFERCVESVYKALSWSHATNEPGRIGKTLITTNAFYPWARSHQGDTVALGHHEHIHDLERALCILNGDAPPTHTSPGLRTIGRVPYGKWVDVENPNEGESLMRIKCYRKGTCHIQIKSKKLIDDLNRIMANRYPGAIPPPAKSKDYNPGNSAEARRPKTSTALAKTDKQARQAYYTPDALAKELVSVAFNGKKNYYGDTDGSYNTVLEPSAGGGSLVRELLRSKCLHVTAIENDPEAIGLLNLLSDRVNVHEEAKMSVDGRDFFDVTPASYPELFSRVVMNPPFSNAQEVEHVLHAWEFVKPGGRLVAIMSKAVEYRDTGRYKVFSEFLQCNGGEIRSIKSGSFKESGTNVETVMVIIDKPEEATE